MTFIAGLRFTGMTVPWVLDGPMNGDAFRTYVEHIFAPTLMLWSTALAAYSIGSRQPG